MSNLSSEIGSMKKEHSMQDEEITIKPIGFVKISRVGFPIIKEIKFKMFGTIGHNSTLKPQKKKKKKKTHETSAQENQCFFLLLETPNLK